MSSDHVTSTSTQQVVTALITNGVIFGAFVGAFVLLRLKLKRIYEPKSSFDLINDEKKPEPLPSGIFSWILPLLKKSDNFVLQQAGLDGYFFLRYLFILAAFFAVSIMYIFPILIPINASNGAHETGLNQLAYQNVKHRHRYYAHVFCGWVFYWSFLFVVYRELMYFNSLRQAVLSSPRYASKLSSRTVLFQTVPGEYLNEQEFGKLFEGVKNIWIARTQGDLPKKVEEREKLAMTLESTEIAFLKKCLKQLKKNKDGQLDIHSLVTDKKLRPTHRTTRFIGKKVDSIDYLKEEIKKLDDEVKELQSCHEDEKTLNSIFIEFESQYQAQIALQIRAYHAPLYMSPAYVGIEPKNVVWFNLRLFWWERMVRELGSVGAIIALVILWAIPVAFVGMISNITYLTNKLHWLRFIYHLPDVLLGLLTSLAPTVALSLLMMLLPMFIRGMAKIQGATSSQQVEYFTQQSYFAFQVIQVFLVTTITSAATSTVTQIVEEPTSAMRLLAENLPKASNFFIAYIILQGMSIASGSLLQISPLAMFYALGYLLDKTPRKKWTRFTTLGSVDWGTTFPIYTNLAVIVFSYAIISPIILLFGACGFLLLYIAYLYNLTYVWQEASDARGVHYPRAMYQTIVGLYIGQICLLGLFAVGKGWGPIVLQAIGLAVTTIIHLYFNKTFDKLMRVVPVDTMKSSDGISDTPSYKNIYQQSSCAPIEENHEPHKLFGSSRAHLALKSSGYASSSPLAKDVSYRDSFHSDNTLENEDAPIRTSSPRKDINVLDTTELLADGHVKKIPQVSSWKRFFLPHIFLSFKAVKHRIPEIYNLEDPDKLKDEDDIRNAYNFPAVSAELPVLWLPRDPHGISTYLIDDIASVIQASDEGAVINEDGKITILGNPPKEGLVEEKISHLSKQESHSENPFETPEEL